MQRGQRRAPGVYEGGPSRWVVDVSRRDPATGRQVRRQQVVESATLNQAIAARAALLVLLDDELAGKMPVARASLSVSDYAVRWIEGKAAHLRETTIEEYRRAAELVARYCGHHPAESVTRATVEGFASWLQALRMPDGRHYAGTTTASHYRRARTMFRDLAADLEMVDPTQRVRPPDADGVSRRELRTLSPEQLRSLLDATERHAPKWHAAVHVLAMTGMRLGELRALRWADLDFDAGTITVARSIAKSRETRTKTGDPRVVGIAPPTIALLTAHRLELGVDGLATMGGSLAFPSWTTGGPVAKRTVQNAIRNAAALAKIEQHVTPQVLRRTFNTIASAHADRTVLRGVMGHSSEEMTQRYAHATVAERRALAGAVLGLVGKSAPGSSDTSK